MRAPKQNCPRCNSSQSFRPQIQSHDAEYGIIQVYIRCTVCNWRRDLRLSTVEIEKLLRQEIKLTMQGNSEVKRHGIVNGSTRRLTDKVRAEILKLRREVGIA